MKQYGFREIMLESPKDPTDGANIVGFLDPVVEDDHNASFSPIINSIFRS